MLYGLSLILLGVLSSPALLLQRRPDAKEILDKLTPYQGYIGVVGALWGLSVLVRALLGLGLFALMPLWWITWVAVGAMLTGNGFLLGYGLLQSWVKDEHARAKAKEAHDKLLPYQGRIAMISIGLGVFAVVVSILRHAP